MVKLMIILVGASASGKTEIANILINKYNYNKITTTTTRTIREGEIKGVSYHFITKEEFLKLKEKAAFIETAVYQNEYYGTQKKDLVTKSVIILEPNGANSLIDCLKEKAFVVLIESSKRMRKARMIKRGDDTLKITQRLLNDNKRFNKKNLKKLDLRLKNHSQTLEDLAKIVNEKYLKQFRS